MSNRISIFSSILKNMAFLIISIIAIDILLSSVLFLFGISITVFNFWISFILAFILFVCVMPDSIKIKLFSFVIVIGLFMISIFVSSKVYDFSYDGNAYHKNAVVVLANDWNPIYQDSSEIRQQLFPEEYKDVSSIWIDHYAKGNWIFGASIYKVTGNIETAKSINLLLIFALFGFSFYYIYTKSGKIIFSIMLSLMIAIMPINFIQMFSLYNDGTVYSTLSLFVLSLMLFSDEKEKHKLSTWCWLFATSLILLNIKFTGLAYAGIYSLAFAIYYIHLHKDNIRRIIRSASIFVGMVFAILVLCGSNSYLKNIIDHHHPFYPLYGDDPVDIITNLQPRNFNDNNSLEKLFLSLFSETDNIWAGVDKDTRLKIPFSVSENEIRAIGIDTRVAGFGPLFSGMLLVSIVIIMISLIILFKKHYGKLFKYTSLLLATIFSIILMPDSWWARYAPQTYYIVIIAAACLMFIGFKKKIFNYLFSIMFFALIFVNLSYSFDFINTNISESILLKDKLLSFKNKEVDTALSGDNFIPQLINLKEYNIDYKLVKYNKKCDSLYYPGIYSCLKK